MEQSNSSQFARGFFTSSVVFNQTLNTQISVVIFSPGSAVSIQVNKVYPYLQIKCNKSIDMLIEEIIISFQNWQDQHSSGCRQTTVVAV